MSEWKKRGLLYVIEGPDWSGKDKQIELLEEAFIKRGYSVLKTREPGSEHNPICEKIRGILVDKKNKSLSNLAELFLYIADRAEHTENVITPALERGDIVLTSRYEDSTNVYQGIVRGLGLDTTLKLNSMATRGLKPNLKVYIKADAEKVYAKRGKGNLDRIEELGVEFQKKVMKGYLELAEKDSGSIKVVDYVDTSPDIQKGIEQMHKNIYSIFNSHLEKYGKDLNRKLRV